MQGTKISGKDIFLRRIMIFKFACIINLIIIGTANAAEIEVTHNYAIVAIIDSFVDTEHEPLKGICVPSKAFVVDKISDISHGTSVADAVYLGSFNLANEFFDDNPKIIILPIEINLADLQLDHGKNMHDAIIYAVDSGAKVINMSFSSSSANKKIYDAIEYGISKGVIFVSAAGNSGLESYSFPASYEGVISVASSYLDDNNKPQLSSFSNYNDMVDIAYYGENLNLSENGSKFAVKTGTSYSSALVSGIIGELIARYSDINPKYIEAAVKDTSLAIENYSFGAFNIEDTIKYIEYVVKNGISPNSYKSKDIENNKGDNKNDIDKIIKLSEYNISAGKSHMAVINNENTVDIIGNTSSYRANTHGWKDIKKIYAGANNTVAINVYDKPMAAGHNLFNKNRFWNWRDISQITVSYNFTAGLDKNGKVIATDYLKNQSNNQLSNIVQIASGAYHMIALDNEGKLHFVGKDFYGHSKLTESAADVVKISSNTKNTACITKDKKVFVVGDNLYGQTKTSSWNDIIDVGVGDGFIIGLKQNGNVVAVGNNTSAACEVESLKDIVYISVADDYFIAVDKLGNTNIVGKNLIKKIE